MGPSSHPERETCVTDRPMLEMKGITKRFPGVVANHRGDSDGYPGEGDALPGGHGAGPAVLPGGRGGEWGLWAIWCAWGP